MATIDQFPLEAEISLTDFRSEATVTSRLATYHRLRVRRRKSVVGVLLDAGEWKHLVEYVGHLEAEAERREDEVARAIVVAREAYAVFEPGSPLRVVEIDREVDRLVAERSAADDRR